MQKLKEWLFEMTVAPCGCVFFRVLFIHFTVKSDECKKIKK